MTGLTDLAARRERRESIARTGTLDFLPGTADVRAGDWTVAPVPADLRDRASRSPGREYAVADAASSPVVLPRPRGWHVDEPHLLRDGRPVVAALVDFGLHLFHNARELLAGGNGPYYYLPKMETHLEARLRDAVFSRAEDAALGGTVDEDARRLLVDCAPGEDFPDFLTLRAYDVLLARGD